MVAAMGVGATASGTRAYVAAKHFSWVTPRRLKAITMTLIASALVASALVFGGSTPPTSDQGVPPAALAR